MKKIGKKNKKVLLIIVTIIIALIIAGALCYTVYLKSDKAIVYKDYTIEKGHTGKIEKYDEAYIIDGYQGGEKAYYIKGKISANKFKGFTIITFNLYDKKNNLLGTAVGGLEKLEKNKKYDFKAVSLVETAKLEKIDHYKIKDIKLG